MAGVSGIRAQFENPSSFQGAPLKPTATTPVKNRKGDKTIDAAGKGSSPSRISKSMLANIGKSISQGSPNEAKKLKSNKTKSVEENVKLKGGNGQAMAALAGVIKSASSSPRGSKLSIISSDESSSPLLHSTDLLSLSSSYDVSLQLEHSGEFNRQASGGKISIEKTDSEDRKKKALSTPFPGLNSEILNTQTEEVKSLSPTETTLQKPSLRPKPTTLPKKLKPQIRPKPVIATKPKLKQNEIRVSVFTDEKCNATEQDGLPLEQKSQVLNESQGLNASAEADNVNNGGVNERDIVSNLQGTAVQSQADVTPKGDVGGCKRSNADSGFQEEPYEDDKQKAAVVQWDAEKLEKNRMKRHKIALELLDTEKSYVSHLKIVAEDFRSCVSSLNVKANRPVIPDSTMNLIFLNIGEIYNLNKQLMTDLQERMDEWESKERIGDVVSSIAPFLKLYSMYAAGFEDSMKILTASMSKEKKLDAAVKEFERKIGSGLGVAHYMLEPVQRIPRYKLLLTEYLKYLPLNSGERPLAEKALAIISEAADRTNNRIKELENSNEILAIERSLTDYVGSLLQAHRRFLRKGVLQKLSRKTQTPRMFFLFSDVLIHTEVTSPSTFKFKDEVPLCGMKLEVPKVSLVQHSFEVLGTTRSFILSASCEEERDEWMSALYEAINDDREKRKSIKRDLSQLMTVNRSEFGNSAPIMVRDQNVSQCQLCSKDFTFTFRRHHCRACGRVVCSNCSPCKAFLSYSKKEERICVICDQRRLSFDDDVDGIAASPLREQPVPRPNIPSILFLDPKEREADAIMEGYVLEQDGKKLNRCWYMLGKDLALYKFRAHEDIRATATVPLPGYNVINDPNSLTIKVSHPTSKKKNHNLQFKVETKDEFELWYDVMVKATRLEIAEPVSRDRSPYLSPTHSSPDRKRSQSLSDLLSFDGHEELDKSI